MHARLPIAPSDTANQIVLRKCSPCRTDMDSLLTATLPWAQLPGAGLDTVPNAPGAAVSLWDFLR